MSEAAFTLSTAPIRSEPARVKNVNKLMGSELRGRAESTDLLERTLHRRWGAQQRRRLPTTFGRSR